MVSIVPYVLSEQHAPLRVNAPEEPFEPLAVARRPARSRRSRPRAPARRRGWLGEIVAARPDDPANARSGPTERANSAARSADAAPMLRKLAVGIGRVARRCRAQLTPMPMTQAKRPLRRLAPSSSRPDIFAPSHRGVVRPFETDASASSPLIAAQARRSARRPRRSRVAASAGRRRRIDQQQAGVEIAGRRRPDPAHAAPAPGLRRGDDPQPAGIAGRDARSSPRHWSSRAREDFEAIAGARRRRTEGAVEILAQPAVAIDRIDACQPGSHAACVRTATAPRRWPPRPAAPDRPRTAAWRARPKRQHRALGALGRSKRRRRLVEIHDLDDAQIIEGRHRRWSECRSPPAQ